MPFIHAFVSSLESHALLLLLSLSIWASIVLTVAWLAAARLRGAPPAARYCVWQFALMGLLVVPLLFVVMPGIPLGWQLHSGEWDRVVEKPAANSTGELRPPVAYDQNRSRPGFERTDSEQPTIARAETPVPNEIAAPPVVGQTAKPTELRSNDSPVSSPTATEPTWPILLLRLWIACAAIQLLWLAAAAARGWLLPWRASPLHDQRIRISFDELRYRLGVRRRVRLMRSARIRVPTVIGAIFPAILLPADCDSWNDERIRMVLAHELAHVERRDVFWQLMARVAAVAYWFHPLAWLAIRRMRQEREHACDDRVLQAGIDATDYAAALIEVAAALRGMRLPLSLGVGMAHHSNLESRVRSILDASQQRGPAPARIRRAILLATAALVLGLGILRPFSPVRSRAAGIKAGSGPAAENPSAPQTNGKPNPATASTSTNSAAAQALVFDKDGNQITTGKLHLQIRGSDGTPLAGVHVFANASTGHGVVNHGYKTTASGDLDLVLPHAIDSLRLFIDKPGFVSEYRNWEKLITSGRPPTGSHVPEQYTIRMRRGDVIGGLVVDEKNNPIAGAAMLVESKQSGLLSNGDVKTDTHGRWRLDSFPPGDNSEVRVAASHPDYVSMRTYSNVSYGKPTQIKDLRAQSAVTVMKHGVRITGKITSPDGKPVAGAIAIWGDEPYWEHYSQQEVPSDKSGMYRLPPLPVGSTRLTIVAKGWMPEMRMIDVKEANPPVDFRLKRGKTLRVRVVDNNGKLIAPAYFSVEEWRDAKSLYNYADPNGGLKSNIPVVANKGYYVWNWAPDDAVKYTVSAGSGFSEPEVNFIADDKEHVLVVQRSLQITGRVTDAATGRAIDKFTFVPVIDLGNGLFATERNEAAVGRNGKLALKPQDRTDAAFLVRIEADGYRTAMSPAFRVGDVNTTWDFKLQPADPLHGRVLATRRPVKGAKVHLATKTQDYDGWKKDDNSSTNNYVAVTNERGEFAIPAQFERCKLFVVHDDGYAETDLQPNQQAGDIELQPWAHVEGQLLQAGKPVPSAWVSVDPIPLLRSSDTPYIQDGISTLTGRDGRFVFDHVPPRKSVIYTQLSPWHDYPLTSAEHVPIDLQPGQCATVNLGGNGVSVTGRVVVTGAAKKIDLNWSLNDLLRMEPGIEPPAEIKKLGFDLRRGWDKAWDDTDEGRAYLATIHHDFVRLGHDGSFLINGVSPGEYQFALRIYKHDDPNACLTEPIARGIIKFHVTRADVAHGGLDLGKIEVKALPVPQPGEIVPDFEFATLNGQTKHLSEFRGKYVLLDFWATWCGACVAALPDVHRLAEQYGDRLSLVPISLDADQDALRQFVAERRMSGLQGSLGDWSKTNVPARLGVSSLPTYLLVGPDGKLIINTWSVDQVREKLAPLDKSAAAAK